jgi:hypothetical protein
MALVRSGCDATARWRAPARGSGRALGSRLLALGALGLLTADPSAAVSEYQVKAAFLLNFGKFVEWPDAAFSDDGRLHICVLGEDPFGETLDATLKGRTVGNRQVTPRRIGGPAAADSCQIVFVSRSERDHVRAILQALSGDPVLLVGEVDRFAREGGMINFIEVDQKIRFEINEVAAREAGLKISSQLLKLATIVEGGR